MSRTVVSRVAITVATGLFTAVTHLLSESGAGRRYVLATIVARPALDQRFTRSTGVLRDEADPGTTTS